MYQLTEWNNDPFPHRTGTGFFGDKYAEMLDRRPKWEEMAEGPGPMYTHRRHLPHGQDAFWDNVFRSLAAKYPQERIQVGLYLTAPGFYLLPHTDFKTKKETTMFYLTDREIQGIGTALFKPKEEGYSDSECQHHSFDMMDLVKIADFVPDGLLTFQRSDVSFHGVLPCDHWRYAIYLTRYV